MKVEKEKTAGIPPRPAQTLEEFASEMFEKVPPGTGPFEGMLSPEQKRDQAGDKEWLLRMLRSGASAQPPGGRTARKRRPGG